MQAQLEVFIDDLVAEIEPLAKQLAESYWEASLTGSDEATQKVAEFETKYRLIFADSTRFDRLKQFQAECPIGTPELERQLHLLILESTAEQLPSETIKDLVERQTAIEQIFNTHRAIVSGVEMNDNAILEVLRTETDNARRQEVWEGSKQVGRRVAADLINLVHKRNEAACKIGFDNYYEMSLIIHEIEPDFLTTTVDQLEDLTNEPFSEVKAAIDNHLAQRFEVAVEELRPWHYADVFFQEAPDVGKMNFDELLCDADPVDLTMNFFRGIDLSIDDLLEKSDLYESPGKSQHAFCIDIDREGDIRVLGNVKATVKWLETMLHEYGHAVYDKHIDTALPFTLRTPAHLITTEAIAMLMGRLGRNAGWLDRMINLPPGLKQPILNETVEVFRMRTLIFLRWAMVMISFERELYRTPDRDLNALWWDLVERFQHLTRPDSRNEADWAAKIHIATAPVYYHNYLLGEIVASQLQHTLDCHVLKGGSVVETGFVNEKRVGAYLREKVFKPGSSYHWNDLLVHATGENLNPQYLVDQLIID